MLPTAGYAQQLDYAQYTVKDGLAGARVYDITQDQSGFIWLATDAGVSRFDGTRFRNFTTADSLPDNEALRVFADSKSRVWIGSFRNEVCYYYKGKIHNRHNDSILSKVKMASNAINIVEDDQGNILILNSGFSFIQARTGHVINKLSPNDRNEFFFGISSIPCKGGGFMIYNINGRKLTRIHTDGRMETIAVLPENIKPDKQHILLREKEILYLSNDYTFCQYSLENGISRPIGEKVSFFNTFSQTPDNHIFINTLRGSYEYRPGAKTPARLHLRGYSINRSFRDREGSLWFTTAGNGLFRLKSEYLTNITGLGEKDDLPLHVFGISQINNQVAACANGGRLILLSGDSRQKIDRTIRFTWMGDKELIDVRAVQGNRYIVAGNLGAFFLDNKFNLIPRANYDYYTVKAMTPYKNDSYLVATSNSLCKIGLGLPHRGSVILAERTTSVYYRKDTIFYGMLKGLYRINPDSTHFDYGSIHPSLSNRIAMVTGGEGTDIWVATWNNGLFRLRGNAIMEQITRADGLLSNNCRTIFLEGQTLWVGTEKGLNKIDLQHKPHRFSQYTTEDGLPTNLVNCIFANRETVYVGSDGGMSFIERNTPSNQQYSTCELQFTNVLIDGIQHDIQDDYTLAPGKKNFAVHFVGISFKSEGKISYQYRLSPADPWQYTSQGVLEFPSLETGQYQLEIVATNFYGVKSAAKTIRLTLEAPFWKKAWFMALAALLLVAVTAWLVNWQSGKARLRSQEKSRQELRVLELEQMALRAQMNPHFIFNCLSSVKQYIYEKDTRGANQFLDNFARLIRQTLDNSTHTTISLDEEINYIGTYLALESIRFEGLFSYRIETDPALKPGQIHIPNMILQPYIENCIRHGIRNREETGGQIHIRFLKKGNDLVGIIEDNGVGREKAAGFKSREHLEYQSKGMSLTLERIELYNKTSNSSISVSVTDAVNKLGEACGTRVQILFPGILSADNHNKIA